MLNWIFTWKPGNVLLKSPGGRALPWFPSLWGGLKTGRCCCSQSVKHTLTWWLCQMQTHTHTQSLFSFLRGGALVQGWPLCHHKLICFASLHLSVNLSLLTSPPSLRPPPQNSHSQNFCDQMQLRHLNFIVFISLFFTRAPGPRPFLLLFHW